MIRAVIFDMYETLVTLMTGPQCFSRDMAALAGADVTAFRAAWRRTEDDRMLGRTTFEEAVRSSLEACGAWSQTAYEAILHQRLASREICLERLHPQILPMLDALKIEGKALIVTPEKNELIYRSARNIAGVTVSMVGTMNVYEVLNHGALVIAQDAISKIEEVLA